METSLLRHLKTNMIGLTHNQGILLSVENLPQVSVYHIHGCHHFVDFDSLPNCISIIDQHSKRNILRIKQKYDISNFSSHSRKIGPIILKTFVCVNLLRSRCLLQNINLYVECGSKSQLRNPERHPCASSEKRTRFISAIIESR